MCPLEITGLTSSNLPAIAPTGGLTAVEGWRSYSCRIRLLDTGCAPIVRKEMGKAVRGMSRLNAAIYFLENSPAGGFPNFRRDLLAWIEKHGGLDSMQKKQAHEDRMYDLERRIYDATHDLLVEIEKITSLDAFCMHFLRVVND